MTINKETIVALVKKWYSFSGRATRKDFWLTALFQSLTAAALLVICIGLCELCDIIGIILCLPFVFILISLIVAAVANLFRRLHDLGLSGFWTCYLSPVGLPCMYGAYVLDADASAKEGIERIKNVGSPWLSWILAIILWPSASSFCMLLILLSPGQKKDNAYGANPYAAE